MSSIMSKWSVSREHPVTPDDLDADGVVTDDAVDRWVARARSAYLEQCGVLEASRARAGLDLRDCRAPHTGGARLARSPQMLVTATATEVFPASFNISVRLRPLGGDDDDPLDVTCMMRLEDPTTGEAHEIDDAIRDELIALEHTARHFN